MKREMLLQKRVLLFIVVLISSLLIGSFSGIAENAPIIHDASLESNEDDCLYYFYSSSCPSCEDVEQYFNVLATKHPKLLIEKFEVYFNKGHANLLEKYFNVYKVPEKSRGIPAIFMQGSYMVGNISLELVEGRIKENTNPACPTLAGGELIGVLGAEKSPENVLETLTFLGITGAALSHSVLPGMLALFLVLLAILSTIKDDEILVKRGILFIVIVYAAYLLSGLGFFPGFAGKVPSFFSKIIGFCAVVISVIRIKGFFSTWQVFLRSIPEKIRERGKSIRVFLLSSLGVVIVAILVSLFTTKLTSNAGQLLGTLFTLHGFKSIVFPLMLYYYFLVILPLLALLVALYVVHNQLEEQAEEKAHSEHKVKAWKKHYHKVLNVVASAVMLVIGLVLLFV